MIAVAYRNRGPRRVLSAEDFKDVDEAQAEAARLRSLGCTDVTVLIDIATADRTARAMAFTPPPQLFGRAGTDLFDNHRPLAR